MYSVKAASKQSGITPETLRAWERRYAAVTPQRDAGGRRSYSSDDVLRLQLLHSATELGHPIRKLANLCDGELRELIENAESGGAAERSSSRFAHRLVQAALDFDQGRCEQELATALALLSPGDIVKHVAVPALTDIGAQWHAGEASIAQERILSTSIRRMVLAVMNCYGRPSEGPLMLFGTLAGERHDLGSLMAGFYAASMGCACRHLGDDLPAEEFARIAHRTQASVIGVSLVMPAVEPDPQQQIELLCAEMPPACEVWAGGSAARALDEAKLGERFVRIQDFEDFEQRLRLLRSA